jgi:hypothetical protein
LNEMTDNPKAFHPRPVPRNGLTPVPEVAPRTTLARRLDRPMIEMMFTAVAGVIGSKKKSGQGARILSAT